eukprot:CAMPEP_0202337816 /NCGR_PEP_ID=MMETSP1126-20121109/350_1 /ASSEMBLY_ACC=CAM_ASM_000457 /TAXON_ID=3047 /ORGANISM="Dunaliella tertiolecta, Strain CCMP1320" /LENGTH=106 /DNA_ID=CAMNT_0048928089 /DNA_START=603 /DNA_END=920 /DNA_ORIENTATION=-
MPHFALGHKGLQLLQIRVARQEDSHHALSCALGQGRGGRRCMPAAGCGHVLSAGHYGCLLGSLCFKACEIKSPTHEPGYGGRRGMHGSDRKRRGSSSEQAAHTGTQ